MGLLHRHIFSLAFLLAAHCGLNAAESIDSVGAARAEAETRICALLDSIRNSETDSDKFRFNSILEGVVNNELKNPSSFDYPYSSVVNLGKVVSDDKKVRIYSWMFQSDSLGYVYYCFVQTRQKKGVKVQQLKCKKKSYIPKKGSNIDFANWYGALYYKVICPTRKKQPYVFLGWGKGLNGTDFKVAEPFSVGRDGSIHFNSKAIFDNGKAKYRRLLLQYSSQARVSLDYYEPHKSILFDHLIPSEPLYKGIYSYYGPDFTYDEFVCGKNGIWVLTENVDAKNSD